MFAALPLPLLPVLLLLHRPFCTPPSAVLAHLFEAIMLVLLLLLLRCCSHVHDLQLPSF